MLNILRHEDEKMTDKEKCVNNQKEKGKSIRYFDNTSFSNLRQEEYQHHRPD